MGLFGKPSLLLCDLFFSPTAASASLASEKARGGAGEVGVGTPDGAGDVGGAGGAPVSCDAGGGGRAAASAAAGAAGSIDASLAGAAAGATGGGIGTDDFGVTLTMGD